MKIIHRTYIRYDLKILVETWKFLNNRVPQCSTRGKVGTGWEMIFYNFRQYIYSYIMNFFRKRVGRYDMQYIHNTHA